jgi:peptide/nickel transport system substrate-binding protein
MHRWIMTGRGLASNKDRCRRHRSEFGWRILRLPILLVFGCQAGTRPADVIVYASGSDLESANPLVTIHPLSRQVQRYVLFVTLARYDSALAPEPYFARGWSWSGDRRTLSVPLHAGLTWHDGKPTTARDVVFTLLAARDPATGFARAADLAALDTAIAVGDSLVLARFRAPQRDVPALFAELPIVPAHLLAGVPRRDMRRASFNLAPTGNGPFRFVSRTPGQRWIFERNDAFPPAMGGPPAIRQIVVAVVDEPTTKFAGLAAGDLDFAGIAPTMAQLADRDPMIEVMDYPVLFSNALVFNVKRGPLADVRVRRAIDASIDRPRIVDAALAGFATPATSIAPIENPLALRLETARSPDRADSLLDAAGFRRDASGKRTITLELLTVGSGDNAVEQLIQADLAERGITVSIRQLELAAFLERARAREKQFDMLVTGIPGDLSLSYLSAMFESQQQGGSLDYAGFRHPALDAAFARARQARDQQSLTLAWHDAQRILASDVPVSWLYHSRGVQGVSARMRGVTMDLRGELVTVARWSVGAGASRSVATR